jgi:predicted tellurium resistance membrane protein TerC
MTWLTQPEALALLFLLSTLEIILSVDNHALVTTMTDRLEANRRRVVHAFAFGGTLLVRTALLVGLFKLMQSHTLAITLFGDNLEARQVVLILGGAFLILKSAMEIVAHVTQKPQNPPEPISTQCLLLTAQIIIIDVILSIDSMMAALAVANDFRIIITALVMAQLVMMMFGHKIQAMLYSAPTLETVALVVLHAVGWISVLEGTGVRVPETHLFVAAGFATVIEVINLKLLKMRAKSDRTDCSSSTQPNYKKSGRVKGVKQKVTVTS